jgi:LPXTG-site transpeptidase (sortase) family protein
MNSTEWEPGGHAADEPENSSARHERAKIKLLYAAGVLFFALSACYIAYAGLSAWIRAQNRFLLSEALAPHTLIKPTPTATPEYPIAYAEAGTSRVSWPDVVSGRAPPVRVRIPAIGVDRAIVELEQIRDPRTGAWTRDVEQLFRRGRTDLVGHWGGSAYPGGDGNVVLVGHNYGYTGSGVFLNLGRLASGDEVEVVDEDGQTFAYRVTEVQRLPWRKRNFSELEQHSDLLYAGGPERLTLVTCSGGSVAPFSQRIYVLAEPAPQAQ